MNDTPGWASPGSGPSDGQPPATTGPAEPSDRPGPDQSEPPSKWSKEQPPPGQWSAPAPQGPQGPGQAPPPPPPGPGWGGGPPGGYGPPGGGYGGPPGGGWNGGPGGWGAPWGGPPPAAKPGVIPLRPLGVGEILDGAVSTMRTYWRTVLGISLTVAVATQVGVILLQGFVLNDTTGMEATLSDPNASFEDVSRALGDVVLGSVIVLLITLLGTIAATALLTTVTSRAVLGRTVSTTEAWQDARPQLHRLFGLTLLLPLIAGVIMAVGALPGIVVAIAGNSDAGIAVTILGIVACFIVAIWLMVRFSLASPALMLEKQGIWKSIGRSSKLVRGSWWRVCGIQLLAAIIANVLASIIVIPFTFFAAILAGDDTGGFLTSTTGNTGWTFLIITGIGSVIGSMLTFPITAGVTVLLYIDQRIRREALDLDLARAAGIQGYGTSAPGATTGS